METPSTGKQWGARMPLALGSCVEAGLASGDERVLWGP